MKPVLYRYRDSESVIKHMDGYTPGEGWEPLYSQDQISSAVNAALEATAPDERVKELEAELAATEIAIAEYRQQCLDNAAEIARLRSESEERLQNCVALVAENERLRAAPATAPEKTVKEIMEFVRHYAANTFSSATLEDKIRRSLAAPATAPEQMPLERDCICHQDLHIDAYSGGAAPEGIHGALWVVVEGVRKKYVLADQSSGTR